LLQQRLVTHEQLEEALRARSTWGNRLGSNLVRLGILDLDTLAQALSQQHGVPAALGRDFRHIPPGTWGRLPPALVEKYLAVPLALQHDFGHGTRSLKVAVPDPDAVSVIDELAFAAGMRVLVNVAPELRLLRFLEWQNGLGTDPPSTETTPSTPATPPGPWLGDEDSVDEPLPSGFSWEALPEAQLGSAASDDAVLLLEEEVFGAPHPSEPPLSATETVGRLSQGSTRDEVGELLLRFIRRRFTHGLVFVVREGVALGWRGFVAGGPSLPMHEVVCPLNLPSCLRLAYDRRAPYCGPPHRQGEVVQGQLWRALQSDAPREVLVAPLVLGTRVAGFVYAHALNGMTVADQGAEEVLQVCAAACRALVRLGVRSR
jgi:hypothetical protein